VKSSVARLAVVAALGFGPAVSAQIGGKPATGNPTPGTAQPDPPNVAARVTLTGCLGSTTRRAEASASATPAGANTPSNARFELTKVERSEIKTYRLEGIDSQFSPFVGARVEVAGEIKGRANANTPTLLVEFTQRLAGKCP
jgi:hypothetical protein